jgi:hypothetical protein
VDIDDNNIRRLLFRQVGVFAVSWLVANRPAWLASQHGSHPLTHVIMIVDQQNT